MADAVAAVAVAADFPEADSAAVAVGGLEAAVSTEAPITDRLADRPILDLFLDPITDPFMGLWEVLAVVAWGYF